MRMTERTAPVSKSTASHYTWASVSDGWRLVDELTWNDHVIEITHLRPHG
jgi:hypothetical protein